MDHHDPAGRGPLRALRNLFMRDHRPGGVHRGSPGRETLGLALVAAGVFWEATSGYWDVYSHRIIFKQFDPWWNPAHLSIYAGVALAIIALAWATRDAPGPALRPAFRLMTLGVGMQLAAGIFNEAWHRLGGPLLLLEPPHVLLVLGMIAAAFGAITGLATLVVGRGEAGGRSWRSVTDVGLLLAFASMWLVVVGSMIFVAFAQEFQGGPLRLPLAMMVAAVGALVALPVVRAAPWPGFATALGALVAAVNWLLLVGYLGIEAYVPWGVVPLAVLDLLQYLLGPRLQPTPMALLHGGILGALTYLASFPFAIRLLALPGANLDTLAVTVSGIVGGLVASVLIRGTGNWVRRSAEAGAGARRPMVE